MKVSNWKIAMDSMQALFWYCKYPCGDPRCVDFIRQTYSKRYDFFDRFRSFSSTAIDRGVEVAKWAGAGLAGLAGRFIVIFIFIKEMRRDHYIRETRSILDKTSSNTFISAGSQPLSTQHSALALAKMFLSVQKKRIEYFILDALYILAKASSFVRS